MSKNNIVSESFAGGYKQLVFNLLYQPSFQTSPKSQKINESIGVRFEITDPFQNLFLNDARDLPLKYLTRELILYFSAENSISKFEKASKFWKRLANEDGTVNSSYGFLIFSKTPQASTGFGESQWEWAINSFKRDLDTRQAVLFVSRPWVQTPNTKDFICTLNYHFFIRDNKLYLIVNRRSQDIFFGLTFDAPWEMLLMQCMRLELLDICPDLKLGSYILNLGSVHAYERDFEILEKMNDNIFWPESTPKIKENPILNPDVISMSDFTKKQNHKDPFIDWLFENSH